ncbi:MAG TPA: phage capsid protein, partial [Methylophaga sp.]|nr:phage capsid protein [Methylophaga sp.]
MQSVMKHRFSEVPTVEIPRSRFDRSHGFKTTFDAGNLVPIFVDMDIMPGDTVRCDLNGFARLSTPVFPIMDNMVMDTFFFFVPHRLIWDNWAKFMGEQIDPGDSISYTLPQVTDINNAANESLVDYFGLPTKVAANMPVNSMAFRAYNLIWNQWFRDQNLQDSVVVDKDDGPDSISDYVVLKRGKRHDYFTSCLPWLQKGDSVSLPLGTVAPVDSTGAAILFNTTADTGLVMKANTPANTNVTFNPQPTAYHSVKFGATTGLETDLSGATASTVNELREAFQVQKLLEKDARAGTRYVEIIESHFGVTSADQRLQRPEYLGGGTSTVNVTPIARTDSSPGELGAMGTVAFGNHGFVKSFTEHGTIIGLTCVRADLTYQEGIDRMWSRQTRYDLYWPSLAHLGEQAVLNKEIYVDAATIGAGTDEDVFGYQERWAELRYRNSKITGKFRSNDAASLDAWHLGIEFGSQPTLDDTFIVENPPIDRVIATPSEPHFIFDSYIKLDYTRPMPTYSVPGL